MKRGTPKHPKMYALAEALGVAHQFAVGIMEMLWIHAAQHTPSGDIGSLPDSAIAQAVGWPEKKAALLIGALTSKKSQWLDPDPVHRLVIHDWPDHCDEYTKKVLRRLDKDFVPVYGKSVYDVRTKSGQSLDIVQPSREAKAMAKAEVETTSLEETPTREGEEIELPNPTITNEYGRVVQNPEWVQLEGILRAARGRIGKAADPVAYERTIIANELRRIRKKTPRSRGDPLPIKTEVDEQVWT